MQRINMWERKHLHSVAAQAWTGEILGWVRRAVSHKTLYAAGRSCICIGKSVQFSLSAHLTANYLFFI